LLVAGAGTTFRLFAPGKTLVVLRLSSQVVIALALASTLQAQPWAPPADGNLKPVERHQIVARINGRAVLASEVLWQVNLVIEDNKASIPSDKIEEVRQMLLRRELAQLVDLKIIYSDFLRETAGRADMKAIEENLAEPFEQSEIPKLMESLEVDSTEALAARLMELGTSIGERRAAFQERAIASQWIMQQVKPDKPTHADLIERYHADAEKYDHQAQARWEELMVRFASYPSGIAARNAVAELGNLAWPRWQAAASASEPVFGDIARQRSEGFTAADGGLHDWTTQGALRDQQIDQALFALPVGAMSPILETELGFHIIRVLERKPAGRTPFHEVQDDIRQQIIQERNGKATEKFVKSLRESASVWTMFTGDTTAEAFLRGPDPTTRR
jgi:hypothetical protein